MPETVVNDREMLRIFRQEFLRALRKEGHRVRRSIQAVAPKRTGLLRKRIRMKTGWDIDGPWARISTSARRVTTSKTGETKVYRYGLAIQQQEDYLGRGLQRTPRR